MTPITATTIWTMSSIQSKPPVSVKSPRARATNVPISAATMATPIVSQIGCSAAGHDEPGQRSAMGPTTMAPMIPVTVMLYSEDRHARPDPAR